MYRKLQKKLKEFDITYYIVPTDDPHQSEIVSDHDQFRRYLSGFTGSAGTLLVGLDDAYLWTDGRYFIQAARQLYEGITLMKAGLSQTPSLMDFLCDVLKPGDRLGFDGKVMPADTIVSLAEVLDERITLVDIDLTDLWEDRPARSQGNIYLYDHQYHGRDVEDKLSAIRTVMQEEGCNAHLVTQLDDIAWIFNLRGHDGIDSPTAFAFAIITLEDATLYLQEGTYTQELADAYASCQIKIAPYEDIYQDAALIEGVVMLDTKKVNYALASSINCDYVDCPNPSQLEKAIKNEVEIKNAKNAHLKDGIAVTKFMYWLKTTGLDTPQTEISLAEKLASFRRQQPLYVMDSFTTICAYRENGAIIHYHAVPEHNAVIKKEHMVMIDSGGQYFDGTTDITRTFVLGELSEAEKHDFTLVLKGFLHLLNARFPEGTSGSTLDMLARAPLWQEQKNYLHGTGHGVGHFLNVHEGPQNIRYNQKNEVAFVPGMITSDEPGYYLEGQYGIRHENLILCIPDETEGFYRFESLTLVPIDLDGIDVDLLNEDERKWLNFYHSHVYNKLKPYLTSEEAEWLKQYTRAIGR